MKKLITSLLLALPLISGSSKALAADLSIEIEGFRNSEGSIQLIIYDNENDFDNDSVEGVFMVLSTRVTGERMKHTFHDIPIGHYAVTVIHDENDNQILDMSGRTPLEGLAYSGTKSRLTKPSFERAATKISRKNELIRVKVNYYQEQ